MMESDQNLELLTQLLPNIASQMRASLSNIYFAATAIVPASAREKDPALDAKAAILDQAYYQLLRLVNNLTVTSYLKNDQPLSVRDIDLVALIQENCDKCHSLANLLGLKFSFVCAVPSHICAVYRDSIDQLLFQLLSNAFKFTPKGGSVTVELKFAGGKVLLSVSNTGEGISKELLPSLFNRYTHEGLMNPPPHGLGLGLPLCRRIAEGHGGTIMAESREGEGTCITMSIPDRQTGKISTSDVPFDYTGGFNRTLLALSDALPAAAFRVKNQD